MEVKRAKFSTTELALAGHALGHQAPNALVHFPATLEAIFAARPLCALMFVQRLYRAVHGAGTTSRNRRICSCFVSGLGLPRLRLSVKASVTNIGLLPAICRWISRYARLQGIHTSAKAGNMSSRTDGVQLQVAAFHGQAFRGRHPAVS